jgi:hypothetical protein
MCIHRSPEELSQAQGLQYGQPSDPGSAWRFCGARSLRQGSLQVTARRFSAVVSVCLGRAFESDQDLGYL